MESSVTPLLAIVGPTASGKTEKAIELAKLLNGEIICADSRTVYKGMDIGTAKPTKDEQSQAKHHLIDIVNPNENFTVADFQKLANQKIKEIHSINKLPIMVGGSGLYIDSVIYDYQFLDTGAERDPINPRHLKNGIQKDTVMRKNTIVIGISPELSILKDRITERVEEMVDHGFIEEVISLYSKYPEGTKSLNAPGYKAFKDYIDNKISLDEAKAKFVRNDYLLARKQRTWFNRNKSIHWNINREEVLDLVVGITSKNN
ncbi:MAG: tRNA (adenosine(37)-N6)-dimethylallyltransferase MiaA [Candidatus Saccharimonadales bacterium]